VDRNGTPPQGRRREVCSDRVVAGGRSGPWPAAAFVRSVAGGADRRSCRRTAQLGVPALRKPPGVPISPVPVKIPHHLVTTASEGVAMSDSVYRVMEVIGSSSESWEKAARNAVDKAGIHREDLRIAEAVEFDMKIEGKQIVAYRTKVKISYKYHEMV
jgi:flavin-binding protein dodecin